MEESFCILFNNNASLKINHYKNNNDNKEDQEEEQEEEQGRDRNQGRWRRMRENKRTNPVVFYSLIISPTK